MPELPYEERWKLIKYPSSEDLEIIVDNTYKTQELEGMHCLHMGIKNERRDVVEKKIKAIRDNICRIGSKDPYVVSRDLEGIENIRMEIKEREGDESEEQAVGFRRPYYMIYQEQGNILQSDHGDTGESIGKPEDYNGSGGGSILVFSKIGGDEWRLLDDCVDYVGDKYLEVVGRTMESRFLEKELGAELYYVKDRGLYMLPYMEEGEPSHKGVDLIFECVGKDRWRVTKECKDFIERYENEGRED